MHTPLKHMPNQIWCLYVAVIIWLESVTDKQSLYNSEVYYPTRKKNILSSEFRIMSTFNKYISTLNISFYF